MVDVTVEGLWVEHREVVCVPIREAVWQMDETVYVPHPISSTDLRHTSAAHQQVLHPNRHPRCRRTRVSGRCRQDLGVASQPSAVQRTTANFDVSSFLSYQFRATFRALSTMGNAAFDPGPLFSDATLGSALPSYRTIYRYTALVPY